MFIGQVVGNLGKDAEMKYSGNGTPFLRFPIASNDKVREGNEWVPKTEWVQVTIFGPRAEALQQYLVKGQQVWVSGRLEMRPWIDKEDNPQAGVQLVADQVQLLSGRQEDDGHQGNRQQGGGNRNQQQGGGYNRQQNQQRGGGTATATRPARQQNQQQSFNEDDDDLDQIPF